MGKHNTAGRHQQILELLQQQGEVRVDELAGYFHLSSVTIRKDLDVLEHAGQLVRRHGGAILASTRRRPALSPYKQAIAREALRLVRPRSRIILDSGHTTAAMLPGLGQMPGLVVMTNALSVANALSSPEQGPTLLMSGGTWDPQSASFQGQQAEQALRAYDFDQLFTGADGIDPQRGTTSFSELLGLSRVMAEVAREVVVLAEADKVGRRMPNLELPWPQVQILITDSRLPDRERAGLEAHGIRLICAIPD